MDDFLILDTDKNKLKHYWKIIVSELEKLKLKENKKSNISKSSVGFIFLGYRYQVINNKLRISSSKKTYQRIKKKLKYLKEHDYSQYIKTLASYYGYFKVTHHLKDIYLSYIKLSNYSYNKNMLNRKLLENVKKVIDNYPQSYNEINSILENI